MSEHVNYSCGFPGFAVIGGDFGHPKVFGAPEVRGGVQHIPLSDGANSLITYECQTGPDRDGHM